VARRGNPAPPIDKARVLEVLAANPGATKRDLVRLMGVKGSDRIILKRTLKELAAEGHIEGNRKRGFSEAGALPAVAVLEITAQDMDGELIARPLRWEGEDEPPPIFVNLDDGAALKVGERILARLRKQGEEYEARIIRRLGMEAGRLLGVVRIEGTHVRIAPIERKAKSDFHVDARDLNGAENNELVLAEPLSGRASGFPRARIVERLGSMDAPKAISLIAIHAHGISTEFPESTLAEARAAQAAALGDRTDLRGLPLVTIDPEDARDFDDAVWAAPDPESKGIVALVAIADVAHYVTPASALDKEAYKRGNSVYFPDRVVPMLPEELSADLCSLRPNEDRPCMAVRMWFDQNGKLKRHEFVRGLMRSAARLTYAQAQKAFDGVAVDISDAAKAALKDVWTAYQVMLKGRESRDPLDLDLPERRIRIGEDGKISSIAFKERLESMKLIEEFMVMANVAAAETLEKRRQPLIYRVHEEPSKEKLRAFADFLRTIGIDFAKGQVMKPGIFNRILAAAKGTPHEAVMNDIVLRTQAQAIYDSNNIGHFGLHLAKYAHFTSPIRRYADLVVHRALIRALKLGDGGLNEGEEARLAVTAEHISVTERRAMAAERDSNDRYVAAFMQDRIGATFSARITGVTRFGLFVRLADTGAEGLLPARVLGTEYFHHDERKHALIGERTRTTYSLGDTVAVRLVEAAPLTGGLRFDLAEAETPTPRRPAPLRPRSKRRR
jgi:ribonuclease R